MGCEGLKRCSNFFRTLYMPLCDLPFNFRVPKLVKRGFSVGIQAATIPTVSSILANEICQIKGYIDGNKAYKDQMIKGILRPTRIQSRVLQSSLRDKMIVKRTCKVLVFMSSKQDGL